MELLAGLAMHAERQWRFNEWWRLLARLDPIDARCLVLRVLHGMYWDEIGERLDVSGTRVADRFNRARRCLKQHDAVKRLCA